MASIPVLDHDAVLAAVKPGEAIERVRDGFVSFARGEWEMPAKVYLPSPPNGDFRAMPARGEGLATLKWVTSFPGNPRRGFPTVTGIVIVSDANNGELVAMLDARAVTALRTGAAAAVAAQELAHEDAGSVGLIGCGLHGAWVARCMAEAEYGPGVCFDPDPGAAGRVAGELDWEVGDLGEALACDVVCCVTPGNEPVITETSLRTGQHLNMLGADGPGKAEATLDALRQIAAQGSGIFCDEWDQARHGGELTAAIANGIVTPEQVTELGSVCAGLAPGRQSDGQITLFDSTGLAIQDLAIVLGALEALRAGVVKAQTITL
jgi:ornithine cyclodeaminase/alanine dehydrogenase-like protein (mu-crystallin family)